MHIFHKEGYSKTISMGKINRMGAITETTSLRRQESPPDSIAVFIISIGKTLKM